MTKETVQRLAALSHIAIDDTECEALAMELQGLCALTDALIAMPKEPQIEDAVSVAALRSDHSKQEYTREELLQAAPVHDGETFLVPRTVEE